MALHKIVRSVGQSYYFTLPFKRNQDVILCRNNYLNTKSVTSIVDGWHNPDVISDDTQGRKAAAFIANSYPKTFLKSHDADESKRAQVAANKVNDRFLKKFPSDVSSVGAFIFRFRDRTIISSIGTINVYACTGDKWGKPAGIKNALLDWTKYASGSKTFFGRGELNDPIYSHQIDTAIYGANVPILVLTDGADRIINENLINALFRKIGSIPGQKFMHALQTYIITHRSDQNDDISSFLSL